VSTFLPAFAEIPAMKFHRHVFPSIEQYLHHRPPYLLVDEIVELSANGIVTRKRVTGDEFFLAGHFPGSPIFPGAMLQELTTQSAGILIAAEYNPMPVYDTTDPFFNEYALGVLVRVEQARYRSFARPGDLLEVKVVLEERVEQLFDFRATVTRVGGPAIMRNSFQLTNIKSTVLQGREATAG
jgi:3-hydroxyacyl-[acyl-carrier-protein] dehydratase